MATITLSADLASLTRGLAFVVDCATSEGLPPQRVMEIELAVEEALANICRYSYPPDHSGVVEVRCTRDKTERFLIELIDTGVPFDILAAPAPDLTVDFSQRQIGCLGIPLILSLVDSVTYHRDGVRNVLELAVRLPL
jgi:anti-sigma regulatory factor (Ser/Thr protein kinase)